MIFDPHTQTNLLPSHGYSHGPQIGCRPSPSIKKGGKFVTTLQLQSISM